MRGLQRRWNREKRFSRGGEIPRSSLMNMDLGGELILEVCLGPLDIWMATYSYLRCCHRLCQKGGQTINSGINAEDSRKPGQYKVPSHFPHIFSSTHRILVKFGTYGKMLSRSIQCCLGRDVWRRTHEER